MTKEEIIADAKNIENAMWQTAGSFKNDSEGIAAATTSACAQLLHASIEKWVK